jgi:alkaline phosphatase
MKKFFALLLSIALVFSSTFVFSGCSNKHVKNIILIIGDGMGYEHIYGGELCKGSSFAFRSWNSVNVNTDSLTSLKSIGVPTDSAASSTALATGTLTLNGYVGKDDNANDLKTILDYASEKGKSTGIVTTDTLLGATPSGFSAHAITRGNEGGIFDTQVTSGINLLCGSIYDYCTTDARKQQISDNGYTFCDDFSQVDNTLDKEKAYWQFDLAETKATVKLYEVATKALDFLSRDNDGFVLMIEQAHVDKYAHSNNFNGMQACVRDLDKTVDTVYAWAKNRNDTAILVTADHETGGLKIGASESGSGLHVTDNDKIIRFRWSTTSHTNRDVGLFTYGFHVNFAAQPYYKNRTRIKNINIFNIMKDLVFAS